MKQAKWIWYPGDFEMWLGNRFNNLRSERGAMSPTFWKQDSHYPMVEFSTKVCLSADETVEIFVEGDYNVAIDGVKVFGMPRLVTIPKGCHAINIKVVNQSVPPSLFVRGATLVSDSSWLATFEDKIWIDENGEAHGSGMYVPAASWTFDDPECPPSQFHLERKHQQAVSVEDTLYDFGRETMGYLTLEGISGTGEVTICYGESREEALDKEYCETLDKISVFKVKGEPINSNGFLTSELTDESLIITDLGHNVTTHVKRDAKQGTNYTLAFSKAFRYVNIIVSGGLTVSNLSMEYEYLPLEYRGTFRCNDDELNRIWDVGAYTLQLTTREFFMDGIKRDRWVWSGDAVQSFLMNYYLFFDNDCVKRTLRLLRGKDPVTAHINTIMDYTFYWFNGIYDFYLYSGDMAFVEEMYPKMKTLMAYCLGRTDENGMAKGQPDDWIFVDWVDFPMHKRGVMCFEQILFCKSLETMALCANLCGESEEANKYNALADNLKARFDETFWDNSRHAFLHNIEDGQLNTMVTKFPNMFAIIYDYANNKRKQEILNHVMLNPDVEAITTPYMRFYELEALCLMGLQDDVLGEMKSYWGGMLNEGATSFWEKYIPSESGTQHLAMYGRPYGKSLCHAWGASPIYLLGKYYLGVKPTKPGYAEYEVRPVLGGLEWMEGDVPTPFGKIHVKATNNEVSVLSDGGKGTLYIYDKVIDIKPKTKTTIKL